MSAGHARHRATAPSVRTALRIMAAGALSILSVGCEPHLACDDNTRCGGAVPGTWSVVDACQDPLATPPFQISYTNQPAITAREAPPVVTSSDWCSSLHVEDVNTVSAFTFPTNAVRVTGGTLMFSDDGSYEARLKLDGDGGTELSGACVSRFGAHPSCADLASGLTKFAGTLPADPPPPSYTNVACADGSDGGCNCSYAVTAAGFLKGSWNTAGTVLTLFDPGLRLPSQIDYCAGGDTLTITGHNGTTLFNPGGALNQEGQISSIPQLIGSAGLRTLQARR